MRVRGWLEEAWGFLAPHEIVTMKWTCWGRLENIGSAICTLQKGMEEFAKANNKKATLESWAKLEDINEKNTPNMK